MWHMVELNGADGYACTLSYYVEAMQSQECCKLRGGATAPFDKKCYGYIRMGETRVESGGPVGIGIASYGAPWHVPLDFQLVFVGRRSSINFGGTRHSYPKIYV